MPGGPFLFRWRPEFRPEHSMSYCQVEAAAYSGHQRLGVQGMSESKKKKEPKTLNRKLLELYVGHNEDRKLTGYKDSQGVPTIGFGFKLTGRDAKEQIETVGLRYKDVRKKRVSITVGEAETLLKVTLDEAIQAARRLVGNFDELDEVRRTIIVDVICNLGAKGFSKFKNTIAAIEGRDWEAAATELLDSRYFKQVKVRALRNAYGLYTGEFHAREADSKTKKEWEQQFRINQSPSWLSTSGPASHTLGPALPS